MFLKGKLADNKNYAHLSTPSLYLHFVLNELFFRQPCAAELVCSGDRGPHFMCESEMIQTAPAEFQHSFDCYVRPSAMLCSFFLSFFFSPWGQQGGAGRPYRNIYRRCPAMLPHWGKLKFVRQHKMFFHQWLRLIWLFSLWRETFCPILGWCNLVSSDFPTQWSWLSSNLQELRCFCDLNKMTDKVGGWGKSLAFNNSINNMCNLVEA